MNTFYITTSIPYVNARPHIGFALELLQADVIARWHRLCGEDTFFLTGTDENALKNVLVAAEQGITPRQLCDRNASVFKNLLGVLNISANHFIRTSGRVHHRGAGRLWSACRKEDILLKAYRGLYCIGCEDFYLERDLKNGHCPIHGTRPEIVEEQNYFFRLSAYQEQLEDLIESGTLRILPESRRNEALGFIRQGLQDFSISRPRERSGGWGIPVPGDPSQVLYVWFDALTNYLTGLGYGSDAGNYEQYWLRNPNRVHIIGKDILKFHAIYWPVLLLSAGLPLPRTLFVHGWLTVDGRKVSKSFGNAIDPFSLIERYGVDPIRYYLLRAIPSGGDGDFSESRLKDLYNADLANGLGNLVRRLETLCERAGFGLNKQPIPSASDGIFQALDNFNFAGALQTIWQNIAHLNREIDAVRPWDLLKQTQAEKLNKHLLAWVIAIHTIACGLKPFLPQAAKKIETAFLKDKIRPGEPLFPRLT